MYESKIQAFLDVGRKVEQEFILAMNSTNVIQSSIAQDKYEHWDVQIDGVKYDVKGEKDVTQQGYHWVERTGITGEVGWLYGEADKFAFEYQNSFIIVDKLRLQELIELFIPYTGELYTHKIPYTWYSRIDYGRKDECTMVEVVELFKISDSIVAKRGK